VSEDESTIHQFAARSMGSPLRLTVVAPTGARRPARQAWRDVLDEFSAADAALSGYRGDSGVSALNALAGRGRPWPVDERLYRAVATASRASRVTDGRFDPRVQTDLARLGWRGARFSGATEPRPDWRAPWLTRDPRHRTVALGGPIDLGGIGKGLALRWAFRCAALTLGNRAWGALLDAGGDIVARRPSPQGGPWLVGIEDPSGRPEPMAVVTVSDGAVCTSSTRIGQWRDPTGQPAHHLIDPRTGRPARTGLVSVTVAHADPAWAEIRTKALFLIGRRDIGPAARQLGLAAWWVDSDHVLGMTPAARQRTIWTVDEGALVNYRPEGIIPARIA